MSEKDANVGSISFLGIFSYSYSCVNRSEAYVFVWERLSYIWTIICGTKLVVVFVCSQFWDDVRLEISGLVAGGDLYRQMVLNVVQPRCVRSILRRLFWNCAFLVDV